MGRRRLCLEGVAFPAQRAVADALNAGGDAAGRARRMALRAIELAALAVVGRGVVMVAGSRAQRR